MLLLLGLGIVVITVQGAHIDAALKVDIAETGSSLKGAQFLTFCFSLVSAFVAAIQAFYNPVRRWHQVRDAAETMQSSIWQYRTRTAQFKQGAEGPTASTQALSEAVIRCKEAIMVSADVQVRALMHARTCMRMRVCMQGRSSCWQHMPRCFGYLKIRGIKLILQPLVEFQSTLSLCMIDRRCGGWIAQAIATLIGLTEEICHVANEETQPLPLRARRLEEPGRGRERPRQGGGEREGEEAR
jgi:hypothetical protein